MSRVGIVTLPLHFNYGGILQAFALQQALKSLGYDAVVIGWPMNTIKERIKYVLYKFSGVYQFVNNNIHILRLNSPFLDEDIKRNCLRTFIVGSDQVWRPCMGANRNDNVTRYFLTTDEKCCIRKIAYAASFGIDSWGFTNEETIKARKLVEKFKAVSVRENSGIELCKKYLGINNVSLVLDPTMLLQKGFYEDFIKSSPFKTKKRHCFVYLLDYKNRENKAIIECIVPDEAEILTAKVERSTIKKYLNCNNTVEEWLSSIYNSDIVVTDSFHGCVFSILFHKEFYVMGNAIGGNTRIASLLATFRLQDRFVCTNSTFKGSKIDWDTVDGIIEEMRNHSYSFLKTNLA